MLLTLKDKHRDIVFAVEICRFRVDNEIQLTYWYNADVSGQMAVGSSDTVTIVDSHDNVLLSIRGKKRVI